MAVNYVLSLLVLCLFLIGCESRGIDLGTCADSFVTCPCGSPDAGITVRIPIKECTWFYRWKPYCKACVEVNEQALCSQFRHCFSCNAARDGKCASCPVGRYGDSCQGVCQCQNNGVCRPDGTCNCPQGYSGTTCEHRDLTTCPPAPTIAHGQANGRTSGTAQEGSVVTYSCNPGYTLVGPSRKRCENSGVWSGGEARCEYSCAVPSGDNLVVTVEEYRTMSTSDNPNGVALIRRVNFACSNGYTLDGQSELNCLPSSRWNAAVPTCVRTCGRPRNLHNGRYEGTNWSDGGVVQYYCNDRWNLAGDNTLTCRNGEWTGTMPTCSLVSCPAPAIPNSIVDPVANSYPALSTVAVTCLAGFRLEGPTDLLCLDSGAWGPSLPSCSIVTTTPAPIICPDLTPLENGQITRSTGSGPFLPGQRVEFSCEQGFLVSGNSRVICEADGNWSGSPARCIRVITCPDPGTPENGIRNIQQPQLGRRNRFRGRSRGSLRGNSRVAGGTGAVNALNINIPDGRFRVLTRITYDCESRFYELVGPQHRDCQSNGQWSGRQPTCIPICGKSEGARAPTIINGEVAREGEWPWQVSIAHRQPDGSFYGVCGGTVVSENWIITAAHCVTNRSTSSIVPLSTIQVYLGMYHRDEALHDDAVQIFQVSEIHVHPNYDPDVLDSDIAVMRLSQSATLSDRVAPVCLPGIGAAGEQLAEGLIAPGSLITVTGWGETENRTDAATLMKAQLGTISTSECEDKYAQTGLPLIVTSNMFCAGHDDGRSDTCFGDSGGPAVAFSGSGENRRWYLVGVVSWGSPIDCGIAMQYSGFTRMSRFLSFINQFTGL